MDLISWFLRWLDENLPIACDVCGKWQKKKETSPHQMTTGHRFRLCEDCVKKSYGY